MTTLLDNLWWRRSEGICPDDQFFSTLLLIVLSLLFRLEVHNMWQSYSCSGPCLRTLLSQEQTGVQPGHTLREGQSLRQTCGSLVRRERRKSFYKCIKHAVAAREQHRAQKLLTKHVTGKREGTQSSGTSGKRYLQNVSIHFSR